MPDIQKMTSDAIMPTMLEFLEISYLIYELGHVRKSKKVVLQGEFNNNLHKLLFPDSPNPLETIEDSRGEKLPLEVGQLVSIIRVFANLVHINTAAQEWFEKDLRYFRIVMSLTHEDERQLTMKQWAIVFLRNVAERSLLLREELEKLKIDVKVDQTANFM